MSQEVINILPVNDLDNHDECFCCKCAPEITIENNTIIIIHNSFDGREGLEQANELLKG